MPNSISIKIFTNQLDASVKAEMWNIYRPYYNYVETDFYERFNQNTHYAIYRMNGKLVGFTGLRLLKLKVEKKRYFTIYFGQSLVTDSIRACGVINRTGLLLVKKFWKTILSHRTIFWADTLSYRAYLVFAKNLRAYYPSVKEALPASIKKLRNQLGQMYYPERFCAESGTIRKDAYLISDPKVEITYDKLKDTDISFYAQANPRYAEGHGLLTIGPGTLSNILYMCKKAITKAIDRKTKTRRIYTPIPKPRFQLEMNSNG